MTPIFRRPLALAIVGALALAAAPSLGQTSGDTRLGAYLAQTNGVPVADQLAILDLIARMNHAIDINDYTLYASYYGDAGVIDSGFGPPVEGRAAIVATLEKSAPFISNKRHVMSNAVMSGTPNSATVTYYLTVFERVASMSLAGTAIITDEFVREGGKWRVVRHTTRMDPATLAAMAAAMAAQRPQ